MSANSTNRERKRFRSMGEAATRAYLVGARHNLKLFQRRVAAAEHVLRQFECAKQRGAEKAHG